MDLREWNKKEDPGKFSISKDDKPKIEETKNDSWFSFSSTVNSILGIFYPKKVNLDNNII